MRNCAIFSRLRCLYPETEPRPDQSRMGQETEPDMDLRQLAQDISSAYTPPETGRPATIGDPHVVEELLTLIEDGNYPSTAAELVGISDDTLRNWTRRGEQGETPFSALLRAIKRASAKAEATEMGKVRKAGEDPRFWAASMTYLERRHPDKWARRSDPGDQAKITINIGLQGPSGASLTLSAPLPSEPLLLPAAQDTE